MLRGVCNDKELVVMAFDKQSLLVGRQRRFINDLLFSVYFQIFQKIWIILLDPIRLPVPFLLQPLWNMKNRIMYEFLERKTRKRE